MDNKAQDVLQQYKTDVERWRERNPGYKELVPLTVNDVLFIKSVLHPTDKAKSKDVTKQLITFLCEKQIATAEEIYTALGLSDKPVLKRFKVFRQFALLRREGKKYYLPTPRMMELNKKYLRRICE